MLLCLLCAIGFMVVALIGGLQADSASLAAAMPSALCISRVFVISSFLSMFSAQRQAAE